MILDALLDAAIDTVKLIPFLFITYLIMEALERKTSGHTTSLMSRVGRFGPIVGALVGIVPQCGFSAAASSLYAGGLISIGSLLSVFLSTSDEMLPIFISEQVAAPTILRILISKAVLGMLSGLLVDFLLRFTKYRSKTEKHVRDLCEEEHCGYEEEEGSVLHSALVHTLHIVLFVFLITVALTIAVESLGEERVAGFLTGKPVIGTFLAALFGLIPNCASSVLITQLYLDGMLGAGQMMAGLLVGAGVGLLVLFRTNDRHPKENVKVALLLYCIGVFWGLLIELLGITF
ncbi:MAG: arsenic efflux protein [Lachnospiraceae bacterium]|nr:arsenic efflux protein [Lachnospiraceae bacterium]MCH4030008.1 arsenic efflux protein [Lachnospiraceae bacterium]MCH4070332.1 arsenic efflux protein [Lachnospiraceae bacterium]MCH4107844.1 arsenic efflux protein [Lachnospiraceae bacterium]MCI1331558.1 arsenic efflux protein [Lachnospiraceae bacterium]